MASKATSTGGRACRQDDAGRLRRSDVRPRSEPDARQSWTGSLVEACANVIAGFSVALLGQQMILPVFGIHVGFAAHAGMASFFTALSLMRSFLLRRLFDHIDHVRRERERARQERLRQAFSSGGLRS